MKRLIYSIFTILILLMIFLPQEAAARETLPYEDRYGYCNMLTTESQRNAYKILEEEIGKVSECFVIPAGQGITLEDVELAADALVEDRPDYFYFHYGNMSLHKYRDGIIVVNPRYILFNKATPELSKEEAAAFVNKSAMDFTEGYYSLLVGAEESPGISFEDVRAAKAAYENEISAILQSIPQNCDENQEKLKYFHDYLVKSITYEENINDQQSYSAIVQKRSVCAGYAKAYQDLVSRLGIKIWYLTGFAGQPHAWNVLWVNGECVYVDVTWADQEDFIQYGYYCISKEKMDKEHTLNPEYAAVLGCCNHVDYAIRLTPDNISDSVQDTKEKVLDGIGSSYIIEYIDYPGNLSFYSTNESVIAVSASKIENGVRMEITAVGEGKGTVVVIFEERGCAEVINITVGHRHSITVVQAVSPTCTQEGMKLHFRCTSCGALFADISANYPIADAATLVVPAKGHTESQWKKNAQSHWKSCTTCGETLEQYSGSYTDVDADHKCDICGYQLQSPPATEPTETTPPATEPTESTPPVTEPTEATQATEPSTAAPTTEPITTDPTTNSTQESTEEKPTNPPIASENRTDLYWIAGALLVGISGAVMFLINKLKR